MSKNRVTNPQDIALPTELVPLNHLKTKDGEPVVVRCWQVSLLVVTDVQKSLPGLQAKPPNADGTEYEESEDEKRQRLVALHDCGPRLIEAGTSLEAADGTAIRPAFYFDPIHGEERPRHAQSLPGHILREDDMSLLVASIMALSLGRTAEAEAFRKGRGGATDRVGAVADGERVPDPAAPADGTLALGT